MAVFLFFSLLSFVALASAYQVGIVNKYSYHTTVLVTEKCEESESKSVGHRVIANVHLTAIWQNQKNPEQRLVKIQILEPKLLVPKKSTFDTHASKLDEVVSSTSYLLWENGSSKKIWENPQEPFFMRNLKRGIASILQIKTQNQQIREDDVSGNCYVDYAAKGRAVRKRKGNCVYSQADKTLSQPPSVRSSAVHHHSTADYELKDETKPIFTKCSVSEYIKTFSNTWHRPSLCISSKTEMTHEGIEKDEIKYENEDLESVIHKLKTQEGELESNNLEAILVKQEVKKKNLKTLITNLQDGLKTSNLAKVKSATAFYKLLPAFRTASKVDILRVLKEKNFNDILPQILDLVSASSTESSLEAAFEYFADVKEYDELLERFIISLSILPRPNAFVLKQLMAAKERGSYDSRIEATLLTTIGALLKVYSKNNDNADIQVVETIRNYLENGLKECGDDDTCRLYFLRSLRNAAQPRSSAVFLEYIAQGGKLALEAVLALRNIPDQVLLPESQKTLLNAFNQVGAKQDRSTRAIAAELLLQHHSEPKILKSLLSRLSDQSDLEFSSFLASKILHMMSSDEELRKNIHKLMPEKDISYYYSLSQNGKSYVFRRPMIAVEGTNVTYGLESEMLVGGLLKRSVFDVSFENLVGGSNLLSVGIFAEGLGSFAGGETSDDSANPMAGMEIGFLGSYLRPYIFFSSTSELMSHAWSGTASEPTPVFQCILAFSDDEKIVVLTNGMIVRGQLRGVLSADTSASIKISLWNRDSHSLVQNEGGLLVRGAVTVDSGFVSTQGAIQFKGESRTDFTTDLEFYESPFNICLQMKHPDISVQFDVFRSTVVPGSKYQLKRTKKRNLRLPGRSFALHAENNEMCRILNSKD